MIHAILICYENPEQTRTRWERDVLPALGAVELEFGFPFRVTCVDNSETRSDSLNALFGADYVFPGQNLMYGAAINLAARRHISAFSVYCCSRHGRAFDPTWMVDLVRPMVADPAVGVTGCLWGSNSPEGVAHATGQEWVRDGRYTFTDGSGNGYVPQHVQGGVFGVRSEVLLRCPYHASINYLYTDHTLTWDAMRAGYRCVDVPSVRSIWRDRWRNKYSLDGVKYLHDEEFT